ncbi:MAG: ABC transporter permease [Oscillospiraceae bacterium]|jgi:ABC-2 type transport system permease protein
MSMRRIRAVLHKQVKDTLKNKSVLIQFLFFPIITIILQNSISLKDMPENFFVTLFGTMYAGMAPLVAVAGIIAEEKEKNTLRVLRMANVGAGEYLIGIGFYVVVLCLLGVFVIGLQGTYDAGGVGLFVLYLGFGVIITALLGAFIGVCSRNQMSATAISVPVMCVLAFLPMLSIFNEKIAKVSQFVYTQQVYDLVSGSMKISTRSLVIVLANAAVVLVLFIVGMRRRGLD